MTKMFMVGVIYEKAKILGFKIVDRVSKVTKIVTYDTLKNILKSGGIVGNLSLDAKDRIEAYPDRFNLKDYPSYNKNGKLVGDNKLVVIGITRSVDSEWNTVKLNYLPKLKVIYYTDNSVKSMCIFELDAALVPEFINCWVEDRRLKYTDKFIEIYNQKSDNYMNKFRLMQKRAVEIELDEFGGIKRAEGESDVISLQIGDAILHNALSGLKCNRLLIGGSIEAVGYLGKIHAEEILIQEGVREIHSGCFKQVKAKSIKLPTTVEFVGVAAFSECSNITYLEFPKNVKKIGKETCSLCSKLETIKINNDSVTIHENAFFGCTTLKYIVIDKDMEESNFKNYVEIFDILKKRSNLSKDIEIIRS